MAIAVALAAALGLVKLFVMPQGGSVSLEMLPILFIAVRRGLVPAVTVGRGVRLRPAPVARRLPGAAVQVPLDYPLAFGALGLAASCRCRHRRRGPPGAGCGGRPARPARSSLLVVGAVAVGTGARFVCHYLSGIIFFASYAPAGQPVWLYSLTYNLLYLVPEAIITAVLLVFVLMAYDEATAARGAVAAHDRRRPAERRL